MSLINDALKRANETPLPPPSVPGQAMHAVTEPPASRMPLFLIPILLLFIVGLAVWFLAKGFEVARQVYRSSSPAEVGARELASEAAESGPSPTPVVTQHATQSSPAPAPGVTSEAPTELGATMDQTPPPPAFPELKLQALFYRHNHPTAVISSKSVGIGSKINGATVLSITREGVQVLWQDETRELTLP